MKGWTLESLSTPTVFRTESDPIFFGEKKDTAGIFCCSFRPNPNPNGRHATTIGSGDSPIQHSVSGYPKSDFLNRSANPRTLFQSSSGRRKRTLFTKIAAGSNFPHTHHTTPPETPKERRMTTRPVAETRPRSSIRFACGKRDFSFSLFGPFCLGEGIFRVFPRCESLRGKSLVSHG